MKLKISHSIFWCRTQNWSQLELFTDLQIIFYILKKTNLNSTQDIMKFTFQVISTLIFMKIENMFLINPPVETKI